MPEYKLISSDSHIYEPADLWTTRVEPELRNRAPRIVAEPDGDWWYCDNRKMRAGPASGAQAGKRFEDPDKLSRAARIKQVRPGAFIPQERITDMDLDGVYGEVVYPTAGLSLFGTVLDRRLLTSTFRAYNDWIREYCAAFPERLKGIGLINTDDVEGAVQELQRVRKMGLAGALIPVFPMAGRSYDKAAYEPLWAAAEELDAPLGMHIATNRVDPSAMPLLTFTGSAAFLANADYWLRVSLAAMIFSGVFERHPRLRVGSVEHELGWVPHFLERIDYTYTQRVREVAPYRFKANRLPSDFFHQNAFCSFQEDALGIRDRHLIGVDNLMWGSDYPHVESTFPRSRQVIESILDGVPEKEKMKIVSDNAARLYHFSQRNP